MSTTITRPTRASFLTPRRLRRVILFFGSLLLVALAWELYKAIGPEAGGKIFGWKLLPRANDNAMPHIWEMLERYGRPEVRGSDRKIWSVVLAGAWFSFRLALVGFFVGAALGLGLVNKLLEGWTGAVLAKIAVLVFIIVFIQKRPQGIFAMKGRSAEA